MLIYSQVPSGINLMIKLLPESMLTKFCDMIYHHKTSVNTLKPEQNGKQHFQSIFLTEKMCILMPIPLKFVSKGPVGKKSALVQWMAWQEIDNEPMMAEFIYINGIS